MSGIDIVGLVLSVFPVVVEIVGWYVPRVKGRDANLLAESLRNNEQMFLNSVEQLLRCTVPPGELQTLLADRGGEAWRSKSLNDRVADHLGERADAILENVKDIYKTVSALQKKLPVCRMRFPFDHIANEDRGRPATMPGKIRTASHKLGKS